MPLDPAVSEFLKGIEKSSRPPVWNLPIEESRAAVPTVAGEPEVIGSISATIAEGELRDVPVRVYEPAGGHRGTAVFFHGGGWVTGDLDTHDALCRRVCREAAARVIAVDYRRAPEHRFPAAVHDALAATTWAAATFPHDPVAVWGDSAGGNLAAAVALLARDAGAPRLAAQVLIYPITDSDFERESYHRYADGYLLSRQAMQWFWEQYVPDQARRRDPRVAPMHAKSHAGLAPALILTAGHDVLRDEGRAYAARLRDAGVEVESLEYPGQIHAFVRRLDLFDDATDACHRIGEFLKNQFNK
ncbi:MAG: alpha/beta hydrolase [Planctomycetaceae bacterium]